MPPSESHSPAPGAIDVRTRGDACPGALRLHRADDGFLARLRLPGGFLTASQARALGEAAHRLADGRISITSRGNAELRGLAEGCGAELAGLLDEAGLLPSERHERIRNLVASPASGRDVSGYVDAQLWARRLDELLCAEDWTPELSGRFLFTLDDGRGDVRDLGGDVSLLALPDGSARISVADRTYRISYENAPRAALAGARAFLDAAARADNGAWRVRELPARTGIELGAMLREFGVEAEQLPSVACETAAGPDAGTVAGATAAGAAAPPAAAEPTPPADSRPAPGLLPSPDGTWSVVVAAPLGRLDVAQWRALTAGPVTEVRLTPWRSVIAAPFPDRESAAARLAEADARGLVTRPDSPWLPVGACTGRPGCAKSLADVRADALPAPGPGLPVYWSGCERRCGRPQGAYTDVTADTGGGWTVSVVRPGEEAEAVPVGDSPAGLAEAVRAARAAPRHRPRAATPEPDRPEPQGTEPRSPEPQGTEPQGPGSEAPE